VAVGACSRMEDKQLTINGVTYSFPAEDVFRFTDPNQGHPYVRLRRKGQGYDIIYSEFRKYRRNLQDGDAPLVTSINDRPAPSFQEFKFPSGSTVCKGEGPNYSCGLLVLDSGIEWSVVFNKDKLNNSEAIRTSAARNLENYRR
jgi:hypothetical protein